MAVSFDNIPSAIRTPGFYIEFNNELAGALSQSFKVVMFGQGINVGAEFLNTQQLVNNANEAKSYYGDGSMLANMVEAFKSANPNMELWCIAQDSASNQATGSITIAEDGTSRQPGTVNILIAGQRVTLDINAGDDVTSIASGLETVINDNSALPVTASASAGVISLTCKWGGATGNDIDVRTNYYTGETTPVGLTLTVAEMASGGSNPDVTDAIAALGDEWWNWVVMPYTDQPNLDALETELEARWGPLRQMGGRAFAAIRGNISDATTSVDNLNSQHISMMGTNVAPQPPYIWAAVNTAIASASLSIDPARPLQTLKLTGILPPARELVWGQNERNTLLYDGVATYTVSRSGDVAIERQITTYQTNDAGVEDASYLDINTPETLERIRFEQRATASQIYPRHKLAGDDIRVGAGQAIVRPKDIRALLLDLYRSFEEKGWAEDYEHYKDSMVVERNSTDPNRIDVNDQPNLVNQFRVYAQKTQFIV